MAAILFLSSRFVRSTTTFSSRTLRHAAIASVFITPDSLSNVPTTTNFATSAVESSGTSGRHWKYERIVSVALIGLIPAGLIYPNPIVDYGLAITLPIHGHWGLHSVLEDYMPQALKKMAFSLLYCISIGTFIGLMYLNYSDIGICRAVQLVWSLK